ncbi:hypothetical protein VP01_8918g1, partial [Puccinia sorghi]
MVGASLQCFRVLWQKSEWNNTKNEEEWEVKLKAQSCVNSVRINGCTLKLTTCHKDGLTAVEMGCKVKIQHFEPTKMSLTLMDLLLSPWNQSKQNWLVVYREEHDSRYGWVTQIYSLPDFGVRILVAIKSLCDACMGDQIEIHESFLQTLADLELKIVEEDMLYEILDPSEVFAVCAYRYLPLATFKSHHSLMVLRPIPHDPSPLLYPTS